MLNPQIFLVFCRQEINFCFLSNLSKNDVISGALFSRLDQNLLPTHLKISYRYLRGGFNKFPGFFFFVQAFKIVVDSWKFNMLLLYILWDDWPIFMISGSNEQLQQQLEYTLLKPDCHCWWISKIQSGRKEERYAIKFCFKLGKKKCHRNVWNASDCFWTMLHESSVSFWVALEIQGRQGVCEGWWEVWEE